MWSSGKISLKNRGGSIFIAIEKPVPLATTPGATCAPLVAFLGTAERRAVVPRAAWPAGLGTVPEGGAAPGRNQEQDQGVTEEDVIRFSSRERIGIKGIIVIYVAFY